MPEQHTCVLPQTEIIVSTYNRPNALGAVLHALLPQVGDLVAIHIADDGSNDATRARIEAFRERCSIPVHHHWQEDTGFRKARILNIALAATRAPYLILLDGDCVPANAFVRDHRLLAEKQTFVQGRRGYIIQEAVDPFVRGECSIKRLALMGKVRGLAKTLRLPRPLVLRNRKQRGLIGCNLALWRANVVEANGFDEACEGWGAEDSELCSRLYNLGCERKFVYGRAIVYHLNHPEQPREHYARNKRILEATLSRGLTRCERGLDAHLNGTS